MKKFYLIIMISCTMFELHAQNIETKYTFTSKRIIDLPSLDNGEPNPGVAGPITGIIGNNLLVAGGANFPDLPPWIGGKKMFQSKIYLLKRLKSGKFQWSTKPIGHLSEPVAYSSNINIPEGILALGGENESGSLKSVKLFQIQNKKLEISEYQELPIPVSSAGAAFIGNKVFLAGGVSNNKVLNNFYLLDLSNSNEQWKELKSIPIPLSNAVVVAQNDGFEECIFVIGGRYRLEGDDLTTYSDKIFIYSPSKQAWRMTDFIAYDGTKIKLAAGTGVAIGQHEIAIFGGDQGDIFNKIEDFNNKLAMTENVDRDKLQEEKVQLVTHHPGFKRDVLIYNTISGLSRIIGTLPCAVPVTTSAFFWNHDVVIVSGEIKPGIRSPALISIKISN
ncbi:MAG: hypothetical protein IPL55_21645 [Saprospiraceae bacterium]|nr:hypothetical protein [Saprospiraceae bacterium]